MILSYSRPAGIAWTLEGAGAAFLSNEEKQALREKVAAA